MKDFNDTTQSVDNADTQNSEPSKTGKAGKTFTQEEVNEFVQSRLSRYKNQMEKEGNEALALREAALKAREMQLMTREKLSERNMPAALADVITCADEKELDAKLDAINKIYGSNADKSKPTGFRAMESPSGAHIAVGASGGTQPRGADQVRKAMGLE